MVTSKSANEVPPYISYSTFRNALDQICESKPLASNVDASVLRSFSGSARAAIIPALRFLGFIDSASTPTELLKDFYKGTAEERKAILKSLIEKHYSVAAKQLLNGTPISLRNNFGYDLKESVKGKCVRFFIAAAKDAGLNISSLILEGAATRVRRPKRRSKVGTRQKARQRTEQPQVQILEEEPSRILREDSDGLRILPIPVGMKIWRISISPTYTDEEIIKFTEMIKTAFLKGKSKGK